MLCSSLGMHSRLVHRISHWALFIVYFWFGLLKLFDLSPAHPLIQALFQETISFLRFDHFMIGFGVFEMVIGFLFLWPRYKKVLAVLFGAHMVMTMLPLVILPGVTWQTWGVPTMDGQYILKNIVIIALALRILKHPDHDI